MIEARARAAEVGLRNFKIAKAEYSFDGSRVAFLFVTDGDEKPDLKDLRKQLQRIHKHTEVELRQVGPRDVAKILGGMGASGLEERCCSRFLTEFSPISIKMAKAQGISLNPQEITGMCARLRCCLVYEYEQYVEARKHLPKRTKRVITPMGEGKVLDVAPIKQGTIPVVRATGRLDDTITPYDPITKKGNGFKFTRYDAKEFLLTIKMGISFYYQPEHWRQLLRNAMAADFSCERSAEAYLKLYQKALEKKSGNIST